MGFENYQLLTGVRRSYEKDTYPYLFSSEKKF